MKKRPILAAILMGIGCLAGASAQTQPEWTRVEEETIRHFQALLRLDTTQSTRKRIASRRLSQASARIGRHSSSNLRARAQTRQPSWPELRGNGRKRPLLVTGTHRCGHCRRNEVDLPAFRRRTRRRIRLWEGCPADDKDNLVASLMVMLTLKRQNVPLDRDVIFSRRPGGRRVERWHQLHGRPAFRRDRCRALPG